MAKHFFCILFLLALISLSAAEDSAQLSKVYLIQVSDQDQFNVDTVLASYLKNKLEQAADGDLVILEIDTFGGELGATEKIRETIKDAVFNSKLNIVAYIPHKAISAGAAITVACSAIVMRESAHFGNCAPVMQDPQKGLVMLNENDKITSVLRKDFETACRKSGYPYRLGHAMVSQSFATYVMYETSKAVMYSVEEFKALSAEERERIGSSDVPLRTEFFFPDELQKRLDEHAAEAGDGEKTSVSAPAVDLQEIGTPVYVVIDEIFTVDGQRMCFLSQSPDSRKDFQGLSAAAEAFVKQNYLKQIDSEKEMVELSAEEAYKYHFAKAVVSDIEGLYELYHVNPNLVIKLEPSKSETVVRWLNNPIVASLLIMIGMIAIYAEMHTPGFGVAGATALICFGLYFMISFLSAEPSLLPVILFLLGLVLLLLEIFVIPGFGVAGITGMLLLLAGLMLVRIPSEFFTGDEPITWRFETFQEPLLVVFGGFVLGLLGSALITRFLPEMKWFSAHVVTGPSEIQGAMESGRSVANTKTDITEGDEALVTADLRPSGKIEIKGNQLIAMSNGDYIEKGHRVKIVEIRGNQIIVEKI